jgi:adenylylsulfate kinase
MDKKFIIFLTGLSGSGKTTIANSLYDRLNYKIPNLIKLDGDEFRKGISLDLEFSLEDRFENIRRLKEVAKMLLENNQNIITSFIAPTEDMRNVLRNEFADIIEIYTNCDISTCIKRNPKKLYNKGLKNFTGISQKFEPSLKYSIKLNTEFLTVEECVSTILDYLIQYHYI